MWATGRRIYWQIIDVTLEKESCLSAITAHYKSHINFQKTNLYICYKKLVSNSMR